MLLLSLLQILAVLCVLKILWSRRKLYFLSFKLPGEFALPFIGNGYLFACPIQEYFQKLVNYIKRNKTPCRFWIGPMCSIFFSEPENIEKILMSSKMNQKHDIYDMVGPLLGCGLISASGQKYKVQKRLIHPTLNIDFVKNNIQHFHRNFSVLVNNMEKQVGKETFNVEKIIHHCFADVFSYQFMGIDLKCQFGFNTKFLEAIAELYSLFYKRALTSWLFPDCLFALTNAKNLMEKNIKYVHNIVDNTIKNAINNMNTLKKEDMQFLIKNLIEIMVESPSKMSMEDLRYHILTLYLASEDTTTIAVSFACMCFGMNPEYQQKAYNEIQEVLDGKVQNAALEDISKLKYLDMCVRDVLRLFPIAPFILRKTLEEFTVEDVTYPPGCAMIIAIHNLHRSPKHYEKPNDFYPDHFLPKKVESRHPYAFLPFSAGGRGCIGKTVAYTAIKLCLAYIIQYYSIEAEGKVCDSIESRYFCATYKWLQYKNK